MKNKRSKIKKPISFTDRREDESPPRIIFKDSVNPDDYHYLSTDQWNEQSVAARRLRDAIRWVIALREKMF